MQAAADATSVLSRNWTTTTAVLTGNVTWMHYNPYGKVPSNANSPEHRPIPQIPETTVPEGKTNDASSEELKDTSYW